MAAFNIANMPALPDMPANNAVNAEAITVSYSYGAYSVIEAITTGSQIFELSFGGLNEMNSNSPVILDIYRLKLSAAKSFKR